MLAHVNSALEGKVGAYELEYLRLDRVLAPVPPEITHRQRRWFAFFS